MTPNFFSRSALNLFKLICLLISLVPAIRLACLVDFTCSNVVSTDFIYATKFINCGLSVNPDLIVMFRNSAMMGHPQLAPLFFQLLNAKFFGLNAFIEYYLCISLLYLNTILAFDCLNPRRNSWSYALLPVLSLLQFSLCLSSEFFYCFSLVSDTITRLTLTLGIWAISRVRSDLATASIMFVGGCICSFCAASFVVSSWLTFGFLLLTLRRFGRPILLAYFFGSFISALPILFIAAEGNFRVDPNAAGIGSIFRFIASVGMAFLNNTALNVEIGWASVSMGALGLIFLLTLSAYIIRKGTTTQQFYSCWAFALFGLLNLCCTAAGRIHISPWYCTYSVFIWSSICALAFGVLNSSKNVYPNLIKIYGYGILIFCCIFYALTNLSYADKDYFRMFHSPSAESCLRNFEWAPTYGYYQLFGSKMGSLETYLEFGNAISLNRLSCFGDKQTWSLQGDFILPVVQFVNCGSSKYSRWISDLNPGSHTDYSAPEHLTLAVPTTSKVIWTLKLPAVVNKASLVFDLAAVSQVPTMDLFVKILGKDGAPICPPKRLEATSSWRACALPLEIQKSAQFTIVFECADSRRKENGQVLLKYPRINFQFDSCGQSAPVPALRPSNVDDAADEFGEVVAVLQLDNDWKSAWTLNNVQLFDQGSDYRFSGISSEARLAYKKPLDIDPGEWTEFFFEFRESEKVKPRFVLCQFFLENGKMKNAIVPIMTDEKPHRYCYELKLLQMEPGERISFIQILPVYESSLANSSFAFGKLGFARRLNGFQKDEYLRHRNEK